MLFEVLNHGGPTKFENHIYVSTFLLYSLRILHNNELEQINKKRMNANKDHHIDMFFKQFQFGSDMVTWSMVTQGFLLKNALLLAIKIFLTVTIIQQEVNKGQLPKYLSLEHCM